MALTMYDYFTLQLSVLLAALALTYSANSFMDEYSPDQVGPPQTQTVVYSNHIYGSPPPYYQPYYQPRMQPRYDVISLCRTVMCNSWSECRILQQCPTCTPQPMCINRRNVPQAEDNVCMASKFRQAVCLGQSPSNVRALRCLPFLSIPRGGCAVGSRCVPNPTPGAIGEGFCCVGSNPSPFSFGPRFSPSMPAMPTYGQPPYTPVQQPYHPPPPSLSPPVQPRSNPGVCPIANSVFSQCSGNPCEVDEHCPMAQKCCLGPCGGKTCTNSLPQPAQG